jgi:hypothetical protein
MGWLDALIAALAAIGGGVVGAYASLRQTRETLRSDTALQREKLDADTDLSREAREYQQRRDAYDPMMAYVTWAKRVNLVRIEVVNRRRTAVAKFKTANVKDIKAEDVVALHAAYDNSGPTEWEERMIDAGPALKERFKILGSAYAFASTDVLEKFIQVDDSTERIEKAQVRMEKAIMDFPDPLGPEPSIHEVSVAAIQSLTSVGEMSEASFELLEATNQYTKVTDSLRDTVRAELDRIRSKVDDPVRPSAIATPPRRAGGRWRRKRGLPGDQDGKVAAEQAPAALEGRD